MYAGSILNHAYKSIITAYMLDTLCTSFFSGTIAVELKFENRVQTLLGFYKCSKCVLAAQPEENFHKRENCQAFVML